MILQETLGTAAFVLSILVSGNLYIVPAATLLVMLYATEGAHMNPVLSLIAAVRNMISPAAAATHIAAQCAGGLVAYAVFYGLMHV